MNETEAKTALKNIFGSLKITPGDVVYLGVDMGRLPLPAYAAKLSREAIREREQKWCEFFFNVIMEHLGPTGTLLVPTFTYSYAGRSLPYDHENSPSETGPFTEYVRGLPTAIRSFHPLHSVAGVGQYAEEILGNVRGKSAYGAMSLFARLPHYDVRFAGLGVSLSKVVTYVHHMEQMYGVNHRYNKLFNTPAYLAEKEIPGPWLCSLRYLGTPIRANLDNVVNRLRCENALCEMAENAPVMQSVTLKDLEKIGYDMLVESPWAFAEDSVEVHIETRDSNPAKINTDAVRFFPDKIEKVSS